LFHLFKRITIISIVLSHSHIRFQNRAMDCLNCFPSPRPSSNPFYHRRLRPSRLNTVRDPHIYNARAPRDINRPPTPYPLQEHFTLPTLRRPHTRTHKRYVSQRTVDDVTVVRQWRFPPSSVDTKHTSMYEDKLRICDPGTRSLPRRRRSVSSWDQWDVQLQAEIAAQNDSSRPARLRKAVTFQEPLRDPELQKRIEAQNNRIRMRPAPLQKPPPLVQNYLYTDDLPIAFSDLRLDSRYKR